MGKMEESVLTLAGPLSSPMLALPPKAQQPPQIGEQPLSSLPRQRPLELESSVLG